jgi:hypothetical protein
MRKVEEHSRRNSAKAGEDPLDSPILTKKVWDELYELFKLHFSTEMPFLHPPTFRNRMRQASYPRDPSTPTAELEESRVLLLGVLTLTARFHSDLVSHHSPQAHDPLVASEYYANTLAAHFGPTIRSLARPSLEKIQGLLMLGLYEWGQTRGVSAWLYAGIAVKLAQVMELGYEDDLDRTVSPFAQNARREGAGRQSGSREDATEREVRRRTLWSCFIMDRMLAAGKGRPTMMEVDKLRVQLPCSDDQFLFVRNVRTGYLSTRWLQGTPLEHEVHSIDDDGVLSRYIRLVEIFGRFSEWSYAGGRRTEKLPPWDPATEFYQLRQQLKEFHDDLPSNLKNTDANLSAHIEKRNATTYASMHTLYSLCLIMLHREFIPFIPLRCDKPIGPLDEPTFPEDKFKPPPGFWEESADGIMKASRDIIEIVRTCQENNALPESPQIGFAIWQAAFVCVYAAYFPQMDPKHRVSSVGQVNGDRGDLKQDGYTAVTRKILGDLVPKLKMVKGYLKSIGKMHNYYDRVFDDYIHKWKRKPPFSGGGLDQYKMLEKELKEFGDLRDNDHNGQSDGSDTVEPTRSRASTNDPGNGNGEPMQGIEGTTLPQRPNGAWAPINASSPPNELDERARYPQGHYPYGMPYQQSPNQSSAAPSLVASNGDSTPGLNSPYGAQQQPQLYPLQGQTQSLKHQQNPPSSIYPSIAQHTMAPPNAQMIYAEDHASDHAFQGWIRDKENISMNANFDGFGQGEEMESWIEGSGAVGGVQQPNYLQTIWASQGGVGVSVGAGPPPLAGAWS